MQFTIVNNASAVRNTQLRIAELVAGIRAMKQEILAAKANGNLDKADLLCLHLDGFRDDLADLRRIERAQNA